MRPVPAFGSSHSSGEKDGEKPDCGVPWREVGQGTEVGTSQGLSKENSE